jgi:hypothetical protein
MTIKVSVYARGFQNPWSMAFVSDDTILVAERGGAIKAVRNGVVDPTPVPVRPRAIGAGLSGTDLALHPDFARNKLVYISYTKPLDPRGAARHPPPAPADEARWTWRRAADRRRGGCRRLGRQGHSPARATSSWVKAAAAARSCSAATACCTSRRRRRHAEPQEPRRQDPAPHGRGQGAVRQPFVGSPTPAAKCSRWATARSCGMAKHPLTGAIWQIENGPNGGDEVNILSPGSNYGWPLVSLGRTYAGPWQGPLSKEGFKDPIVYWMPAIAVSSIAFYTGDRLPKWKGDVFVTGMRYGEIPGTGQLHRILINKNFEELRREALLTDLRRRHPRREAGAGRQSVRAHRRG